MAKSAVATKDAIALLKSDHKKVKDLFDQFEKAKDANKKKQIAEEAIQELKIHATIEEEIFYPAVSDAIDDEENLMHEAEEEHHVAKVLIGELEKLTAVDETYEAKFTVLAENVRHHIKEEEGDMFPEAKKTDLDMDELGQQLESRKEALKQSGVDEKNESEAMETESPAAGRHRN